MTILGIDPGIERTGWGILEARNPPTLISYGLISTHKSLDHNKRLIEIYSDISELIRQYHPDSMAIEKLYFSTNVKTAFDVGESRGVILLAAAQANITVVSYSPLTVKHAVCGSGSADKMQIQKMVKLTLCLPTIPKPDDVADAIAIALTHAYSYKMKRDL